VCAATALEHRRQRCSLEEIQRIVGQIRKAWATDADHSTGGLGLLPRGIAGLVRKQRCGLCIRLCAQQAIAADHRTSHAGSKQQHRRTGKPARVFCEFAYRTKKSWSRVRRVVAKAEQIEGKENPRYLVTSLGKQAWPAQNLYEQLYCARGEMENRIKEQLRLFSDRLSTETPRANQLRLYFSSLAYVLLDALRRLGLTGTEWAEAQVDTIRLKLLKIAAQVRVSAAYWIRYSSAYPWQNVFAAAYTALRC